MTQESPVFEWLYPEILQKEDLIKVLKKVRLVLKSKRSKYTFEMVCILVDLPPLPFVQHPTVTYFRSHFFLSLFI